MDEDSDTMLALETQFLRWGRGAVGSAPRWHRGGRGFESHRLHQYSRMFFVYILQSQTTSRYYIGQTQDLDARLAYHNSNWSKSLRNRGPWGLVYHETYATRSEAVRRERQLKSWKDRDMIERLVSASR